MDELEYTINQIERNMKSELEKVATTVEVLQELVNNGESYTAAARLQDTYGIARDVEALTSTLARYKALVDALHMVNGEY